MKFAEHLTAHITPEWRKQYISYEAMKEMIYEAVEQAPSPEMTDEEAIERYFTRFDESFFQYCEKELLKINMFFSEKLAEAKRKFSSVKCDLITSEQMHQHHHLPSLRRRKGPKILIKDKKAAPHLIKKSIHDIKLAFSEFYLSLILLQNYQTLNFTGFRKILKKHDKLFRTERGCRWRQTNVETAPFYTSKDVDHLIKETETVFTQKLEGGDRQKAMKRLRVPPLGEKQNPWSTFRIGLFSGIFFVLLAVIIIAAFYVHTMPKDEWEPALRIYRGLFLIILCMSLLGINIYGWRTSGVNHVLIFELDPRDHLTHQQLLESRNQHSSISSSVMPQRLLTFVYAQSNSRSSLQGKMVVTSASDDVTSGVCGTVKYGIRPIVACLPAWFRFAQCLRRYRDTRLVFPHIVNAGKYSTTFFVVLFSSLHSHYRLSNAATDDRGPYFYLWIIAAFVSACYTLTWDIKMDWGLIDKNAGENRFLREEIVYAHKGYYYFAMVEDFILRFVWTLTVTVGEWQFLHLEILKSVLASFEVFRRFIWNYFRLENEHLNNCGQFRAVRDISIAPINTHDSIQTLETMMDEDDGVSHRQKGDKQRLISNDEHAPWDVLMMSVLSLSLSSLPGTQNLAQLSGMTNVSPSHSCPQSPDAQSPPCFNPNYLSPASAHTNTRRVTFPGHTKISDGDGRVTEK
ncbi:hypothetical protein LSH36_159g04020 [Paralvinella palmiformis]|uniref:Xenotropic and polytropic retrovirus receptor 1 n=1 Tax=Paralvinella palmiformis TaxID=53620 RepID=A0AAD9JTE5_9ANNE|nr:hypothetical protein LSH36_159g04020 [Paralvinella palmiformis]